MYTTLKHEIGQEFNHKIAMVGLSFGSLLLGFGKCLRMVELQRKAARKLSKELDIFEILKLARFNKVQALVTMNKAQRKFYEKLS